MQPSTFEEAIRIAIRKEADAANLYRVVSSLAGQSKAFFQEMANEELRHKEILESLNEKIVEEYKLEDVPDLRIGDYLVEKEFGPNMTFQDALLMAMKREEKSVALYTNMAKAVVGTELEKLFRTLAQEESKHRLKLETEYDEHVMGQD